MPTAVAFRRSDVLKTSFAFRPWSPMGSRSACARPRPDGGTSPMRDASEEPSRAGFTCPVCGRFITTALEGLWANPNVGSPRRFCDPACRQAAYRRRRAGVAEETPRQTIGGRDRRLTRLPTASGKEVTTPARQA